MSKYLQESLPYLVLRQEAAEMSMKKFDKRFGMMAIKKGYIAFEQAYEALSTQVAEELDSAKRRPLGEILHEKGYMTPDQIDGVLAAMGIL